MTNPNDLSEQQHDPVAAPEDSVDCQTDLSELSAEERENLEQARYALSFLDRIPVFGDSCMVNAITGIVCVGDVDC